MEIYKINSLVELFFEKYKQKTIINDSLFLKWLKAGKDDFLKWSQVELNIRILSEYLRRNISFGDRCVLLSENRPEWLIADISIMNAGGVTVPLFTTYSEKDYEYILNDCQPKICIVSNNLQLKKIEKFVSNKTKILSIENFNEKIESIENILNNYLKKESELFPVPIEYNKKIYRKDIACIIYTSGTTGNPKGVMLSHGGILSNCKGAQEILNSLCTEQSSLTLAQLISIVQN